MNQDNNQIEINFAKSFTETFNCDKSVVFTNLDCECNDEINFVSSLTLIYNNIKYECYSNIEFDEEGNVVETDVHIQNCEELSEYLNDNDNELEGVISDFLTTLALDLFELNINDSNSSISNISVCSDSVCSDIDSSDDD